MQTGHQIAIVGRPNVGKSTFFNRVLSKRHAIVDPTEGITRDRIYGTMDWVGHTLTFIDTGGYIPDDLDIMNAQVRRQAQIAIQEASLILLMVDGKVAPTSSDRALAQFIREGGTDCILIVNKCDSLGSDDQMLQYYELGIESIRTISALSGRLTGDLLDTILEKLDLSEPEELEEETETLNLALVGMPNVGKSSLLNALLQKEQTIVTPIAGTTRDSIDTSIRWYGKEINLIDTAGLRKRTRITDNIEYYSNVRTFQAIERADVVFVLIDAEKGFGKQDRAIVDNVIKQGKGLALVVNKWDLIEKETNTMLEFEKEIEGKFKALSHYPVLFVSALTKQRVSKVLAHAQNIFTARKSTLKTRLLNEWLAKATGQLPPPATKGKMIRIKFITQVHTSGPIIALFCNFPDLVPVSYKRYLENNLREHFPLEGVPVKLSFRKK